MPAAALNNNFMPDFDNSIGMAADKQNKGMNDLFSDVFASDNKQTQNLKQEDEDDGFGDFGDFDKDNAQ